MLLNEKLTSGLEYLSFPNIVHGLSLSNVH